MAASGPAAKADRPPSPRRAATRAVVAALIGGVAIGLIGRASVQSTEVIAWLSRLGAPWLFTAFVVGACVGSRRQGAAAGGASLAIGTAVYYFVFWFVEHRIGIGYGVVVGTAWAGVGVGIGAVFGYAGAAWRSQPGDRWARIVATAALGGALIGEAVLLMTRWDDPTAHAILLGELMIGALIPFLAARRREWPAALALGMTFAMVAIVLEAYAREALRAVGWGGA
jgi:Family of unknown function (DUF6518)